MNFSQSRFAWIDDIPLETRTIVSGYVREAHYLSRSQIGALHTIPALVSCLCVDYYFERETLLIHNQSNPDKTRLHLDPSRTKAAFDCGFGHHSRELFGSTVTNPSFRGVYRWELRLICADPDVGVSADFGIHTEFQHPENGRIVQKTYKIEANASRPERDPQSVNAKGMGCDLVLDTTNKQLRIRINGWCQWEEDYAWDIDVDKSYCVRVTMHCKGSLELISFKRESSESGMPSISEGLTRSERE